MKFKRRSESPLRKRARRGFRGYPVATVAFYGPDNKRATKAAVGIVRADGSEPAELERSFSHLADVRADPQIGQEILAFLERRGVRSVVLSDGIIGCPHEEGIDDPLGQTCPQCPFWANRDRWTGELIR